ncbi:hypothetical protein [Catenovulum agarivorans]|uniref:hypothetical protein n=1 Tax=Catenovulum agarivorans TaxID=1172192 RepID=UPI000304725A|nr:hypothetical protein [Catenovulum agarivorans]
MPLDQIKNDNQLSELTKETLTIEIVSLILELNALFKSKEVKQSVSIDVTRSTLYIGYVYHEPSAPIEYRMESKVLLLDDESICEKLKAEKNTIAGLIDSLVEG